jgi:ribonuclease BN (tRNA processing enzyme)
MVFDTEHTPGTLDPAALGLMQGADLCFYDANFTDAEFESYRNFGHSTWEQGLRLAQKAGAARIGFVHHATYRTDADLLRLEHQAQKEFPGAFFARDFQKITL